MNGSIMTFKSRLCATALLAGALSGCGPYPFNQTEFGAIVESWKLNRTTPPQAAASMEQKGFKVGRHKAEKYFDDQRDYLYATQKVYRVVCSLEWRVILLLENEEVVEVQPYVFSQCL